MSETAVKKEKKKWSTGKKVAVILCSVLLALILIVVSGGLIYLHNYCQVKDYTVTAMGNHDVTLIAHRGFRAVAPENTLPAFEEAGKAGFTGAECDTYRTKDGVWVISHDSHTYRMMDQHAFVEKKDLRRAAHLQYGQWGEYRPIPQFENLHLRGLLKDLRQVQYDRRDRAERQEQHGAL